MMDNVKILVNERLAKEVINEANLFMYFNIYS